MKGGREEEGGVQDIQDSLQTFIMVISIILLDIGNNHYKGLESALNILGLAGGGTHTSHAPKIFRGSPGAWWMGSISSIT